MGSRLLGSCARAARRCGSFLNAPLSSSNAVGFRGLAMSLYFHKLSFAEIEIKAAAWPRRPFR